MTHFLFELVFLVASAHIQWIQQITYDAYNMPIGGKMGVKFEI